MIHLTIERPKPETPLELRTAVTWQGRACVVVGRSKPVGGGWRYDLRYGDITAANVPGSEIEA